jgi:hypothetical protein
MNNFEYWSPEKIIRSGKYPFSMGQLRHFLLHRHSNGLQVAIRKIGKRLLFRIDLFDDWIESKKEEI